MTRLCVGLLAAWVLWQQTGPPGRLPPPGTSPAAAWNAVTRFGSRGECEASKQRTLDAWRWTDSGYEVEGDTVAVLLEGVEAAIRYVCLPDDVDPRR